MNLKIGIDNYKPGWEIILKQIGVSFSQFSLSNNISPEEYSVIIITEPHTFEENKIIEKFLNAGGAVLYSDNAVVNNVFYKFKKVQFLCSKQNTSFSQIGLVDIYSTIKIPNSKDIITIDSGLSISSIEHGVNLILPFNINEFILNSNSRRKKFFAYRKELPSEIVSEVSKGKLRKIVELSLEYLHHKRDLPFVHLWHQPYIDKNLFIFRLDTDFCSKKDADEMYEICKKNDISATWFLDTESEDKLNNYATLGNQEMAIHCDKHYLYDNFDDNYNNILKADEKLKQWGISATGFAAPFGDWNCSLDNALQKMELTYSSEFALDYDDLPFYPYCNNHFSKVMQIPIHPISLGRLRRSHFNENEMLQYYIDLIKRMVKIGEPVIIYHHPRHKHFDIFDKIFQFVKSQNFGNMNMGEFSNWWEERYKLKPEFQYFDDKLSIKYDSKNVFIKISTKKGYIISLKGDIQMDKIKFNQHPELVHKNDLKRIRKFHWRDILYDHESRRSKKAFK
jgi:peptidoglycan/xylan/chitin deacetylase (PgdA/CDA1 family)